jgi:hypothetical protein
MKKVLVIAYYWPPAGGSAVQRWLKFSRYLPEYGWQPIIYVPEKAIYPETDPALEKEIPQTIKVIKHPITEPVSFYKKFMGGKKDGKIAASMSMKSELKGMAKIKHKIAWWIRSNFFIPDAHFLWIKPSVKYLKQYLASEPADVIVTTGPPQSLHLIGLRLHAATNIPWVADFRDPWTNIDFYTSLNLTKWADRKHHRLESKVLKHANHIIAIGPNMKEEFAKSDAKNITVITNGFDAGDISEEKAEPDSKFSIVHLGTLSATRNSNALWQALASKVAEDKNFASDLEIKLIGASDYTVNASIDSFKLAKYVFREEFVSHAAGMEILKKARVLLLLINNSVNSKGIITGKFFEYLATGRPILLIGPKDGDAAKILAETKGGLNAGFDDKKDIEKHLDHFYKQFKQGKLLRAKSDISKYSRKNLAGKLAEVLNNVTGN